MAPIPNVARFTKNSTGRIIIVRGTPAYRGAILLNGTSIDTLIIINTINMRYLIATRLYPESVKLNSAKFPTKQM